jgi:hypothetical protein
MLAASIRILSFLFGCFIVVLSIPVAFIGGAAPQDTVPLISPLVTTPLAAFLLASGFLSFGVFGGATTSSRWQRSITALLLMLPLAFGAMMLLAPAHQLLRGMGLFFFVPALVTLLCNVWPWGWRSGRKTANNT